LNAQSWHKWGPLLPAIFLLLAMLLADQGMKLARPPASDFKAPMTAWPDYKLLREQLVQGGLEFKGVLDPAMLRAFSVVPRHEFVPENEVPQAYWDVSLPLPGGLWVMQPYALVAMARLAHVDEDDRVLVVDAASGYEAAVLYELPTRVEAVYSNPVSASLGSRLRRLGYSGIRLHQRLPAKGPYDAILVLHPARQVDSAWLPLLAETGRLVMIFEDANGLQRLRTIARDSDVLGEPVALGPRPSGLILRPNPDP
jgi:protein-L-isoaspartate(D-aspartate) O-methyltransferase